MLTKGMGAAAFNAVLGQNRVPLEKRWVPIIDRKSDYDCIANGRQGWIQNGESFATGHDQPPAHPGCRCELQVRATRKTDSTLNGTISPVTKPRFINVNPIGRRQPSYNPLRARVPIELRRIAIPENIDRVL